MAALLACFALAACGDASSSKDQIATSYHSGSKYAKADYNKVKVKVSHNNPDNMTKIMEDIRDGKYDNKVVEMEGDNKLLGTSAQILQSKGKGEFVGAMYYLINGIFPKDYPDEGVKIRLKGLVVVENGARHLEVPKDQLEILE